ncbi:Protein CBG08475 [Caenorhabditis briggsae]|uniref:Uncharacterized protein n=2 Tax=Caenorhabditis briggsae TaxID=6238 RepID=A0AAE9DVF3_CAEBR|nr:Protein CBG08475 [Caenorhabditis briggsae]ULU13355.1 hypothetical protein L3Y34_016091 [Caenorhabditis briggsae]UMM14299.1 hypothetical protein L5515_002157 [Caenorhabditis briggsae]CAP28291.1 Protein CBG08475 [Caenorhabditis briggsae]
MSTLIFLVILPMIFAAQSCKDPLLNECGCARRQTFDAAWLQKEHPDVYAEFSSATIQAPVVTYGSAECDEIRVVCPDDFKVASFNISTSTIKFDPRSYPNPTVTPAFCQDGQWIREGLFIPIDMELSLDSLTCIKQ